MRADLSQMVKWISPGSRVLDLGCGSGELLHHVSESKQAHGYGIEIDVKQIEDCIAKGVNVIHADLDSGLSHYFNQRSFDYVVLSQTLPAVKRPDKLLDDMMRIGKQAIVSFPNMAYWQNRMMLAKQGRMPVTKSLPKQWYDSKNIHLCTLRDFEEMCLVKGISIVERVVMAQGKSSGLLLNQQPNWFADTALYVLKKQ